MSGFKQQNETTTAPPSSEYEWRYEYYDLEEPISFEGLKANRYSIVIGFWVGLAVFVIFMFFVLTLLTKTGAPHPEAAEACEKRVRLTGSIEEEDLDPPANNSPAGPSHPLLDNSLFQCYVRGEEHQQGDSRIPWATAGPSKRGPGHSGGSNRPSSYTEEAEGMALLQVTTTTTAAAMSGNRTDFNIPNFVNSELSSTLGEDDLLL